MNESINIGLFLCRCGGEIADHINLDTLKQYFQQQSNIEAVEELHYSCSQRGAEVIENTIAKKKLNRFVVAGCTPRIMLPFFQNMAKRAGLYNNFVELVNLREQCANVHPKQKREATKKARSLISMGIAKVALNKPLEKITAEVQQSTLIVGGGVTGMSAALSLANKNIPVLLIEREKKLGGMLNNIEVLYPSYTPANKYVKFLQTEVANHNNIELLLNSNIVSVEGTVGNYSVVVENNKGKRELTVGAAILAPGSKVYNPLGLFNYGQYNNVVTQLELEALLHKKSFKPENIVMIQCVGSRIDERPYCSRICCTAAIKNAIVLKDRNPACNIVVLLRGVAEYVGDIEKAREMGVKFIRYSLERLPQVGADRVKAYDEISQEELILDYDLVVLATPLVADENNQNLANMFHMPLDQFGFLIEPHIKLRPKHFVQNGVFVAGTAHFPANIDECISQGQSAAAKALSFLTLGKVEREPFTVVVNELLCRGCGRCVEVCEFDAAKMLELEDGSKLSKIDPLLCKGCGMCAVNCISGALEVTHLTDIQIDAMIEACAV